MEVQSAVPPTPHWLKLPVLVRAVLSGSVMATVGTLPWALAATANQTYLPSVPWAAIFMGFYLWIYWKFARGDWPREESDARRNSFRAHRLSEAIWSAAIMAGLLGLISVVLFLNVMHRLVTLPQELMPDISQVPQQTLIPLLLMSPIVSGIVEEGSFRGYMQGPIERRHGPVLAILVTGIFFGLAHFTHPEVTFVLMPYYMLAAAVYGALAYITNSTLPGMVLHAGGNLVSSIGLLAGGKTLGPALSPRAPTIWETGTDGSFWLSLTLFFAVGGAACWAYGALSDVVRNERFAREGKLHEG